MTKTPSFEYSARSDKDILEEIQNKLRQDEEIAEELDSLNFQVTDGRVYATGTVSSLEVRERLCDIIENVPGVVEVIDDLVVEKI